MRTHTHTHTITHTHTHRATHKPTQTNTQIHKHTDPTQPYARTNRGIDTRGPQQRTLRKWLRTQRLGKLKLETDS